MILNYFFTFNRSCIDIKLWMGCTIGLWFITGVIANDSFKFYQTTEYTKKSIEKYF